MPDTDIIVVDTGPIIALIAALGDLRALRVYRQVLVPHEVESELRAGGADGFGLPAFESATWLTRVAAPRIIPSHLSNVLDSGEAVVIQLALDHGVGTVAIDEPVGRRIARLAGLWVTGSIGILLRALSVDDSFTMHGALERMRRHGVWLSDAVVRFALDRASEL